LKNQHHATLQERVDYLEQAFGDSADHHSTELAALNTHRDKNIAALAKHAKEVEALKAGLAHHASLADRVSYVERLLGDSADKHSDEVSSMRSSHDKLHSRFSACEVVNASLGKSHASLASELKAFMSSLAEANQRIGQTESAQGEVASKLESLKAASDKQMFNLTKQAKDIDSLRTAQVRHAALDDKIDHIENMFAEFNDKHNGELSSSKTLLDGLHGRVSACEKLNGSVEDLRKSHAKLANERSLSAHHAGVQERLDYLEGLIGDSADKHASMFADLKASHDKHAAAWSKHVKDLDQYKGGGQVHSSIEERLNYMEKMVGDSADKHSTEITAAHAKLEAVHGRLQSFERQNSSSTDVRRAHSAVASLKTTAEEKHASLQERVDYLERQLGDSIEKHAREFQVLKDSHSRHGRDLDGIKSTSVKHASVEERLDYVEKALGDSADKHAAELAAAHSKLEQMHSRLVSCEGHGSAVGELKKAHGSLSNEKAALEQHHASLRERVDNLERLLGESSDRHGKGLDAAQAKVEQLHGRRQRL